MYNESGLRANSSGDGSSHIGGHFAVRGWNPGLSPSSLNSILRRIGSCGGVGGDSCDAYGQPSVGLADIVDGGSETGLPNPDLACRVISHDVLHLLDDKTCRQGPVLIRMPRWYVELHSVEPSYEEDSNAENTRDADERHGYWGTFRFKPSRNKPRRRGAGVR